MGSPACTEWIRAGGVAPKLLCAEKIGIFYFWWIMDLVMMSWREPGQQVGDDVMSTPRRWLVTSCEFPTVQSLT